MALQNVMRVDNGNIIAPGMPETFPASKVMMLDGDSVEDRVDANTFGTEVPLTFSTDYTTQKDGYFKVKIDITNTPNYVGASVNGKTLITLASTTTFYQQAAIFVKKGTVIKVIGTTGTSAHGSFFPLNY